MNTKTLQGREDRGFTLVEVVTAVGMMLIVLTASWMLLTTSGENLNRIQNGSDASEANRRAMSAFGRDVKRAVVPPEGTSPVVVSEERRCGMLVNVDGDPSMELVVWEADDVAGELVRTVIESSPTTPTPLCEADFAGGHRETATMVENLADADHTAGPLFSYAAGASTAAVSAREVGLVRMHLRNGSPVSTMNITDRTSAFRVIAFVINGY